MSKIFVIGFPKAGTSSIEYACKCAGLKALHWAKYNLRRSEMHFCHVFRHHMPASSVGMLIKMAKEDGLPLLYYLSGFDAFTQMDVSLSDKLSYWPQLVDVPLLDQQYPNSKFIFNTRPMHKWISSVNRWGNMKQRLTRLDLPGLPKGVGSKDEELVAWNHWHMNNMLDYFTGHEEKLLVFDIENDDPIKLANFIGIQNIVWEQKNKNKRNPEKA